MTYPRVLHIGYLPIGSPDNSGLTLGSLFGGWPEDRLLQLTMRGLEEGNPPNVVLAPPSVAPVDALARRVLGRSLRPAPNDGLNQAISRQGHQLPLKSRARLAVSALNDIGPVHLPRHLKQELRAFKPDVIHSLLGGVRPMRVASAVSRALGVPVVPHFMDDWVDTLFLDGQAMGLARRAVVRGLDAVLDRAPLCLTIGEEMEQVYAQRFGRPCVTVGNSVDLALYRSLTPRLAIPPAPRRLRYVGGLHLGRADVIRTVANALERSEGSRPYALELFVPSADIALARSLEATTPRISYGGTLRPAEVSQALVDADALLFIESSEPNIARFTRLSVSTKVPQYLAAHKPVLVVGPPDQASVRVLAASGAGIYAGDGTAGSALEKALPSLDGPGRLQPPSSARTEWIRERFGIDESRARLRDALAAAAAAPSTRVRRP